MTLGAAVIVLLAFNNAGRTAGILATVVSPGIGLILGGGSALAGLIVGPTGGTSGDAWHVDPPADIQFRAPKRRDFGRWTVVEAHGFGVQVGTHVQIRATSAGWLAVSTATWFRQFQADSDHVAILGERLTFHQDGSSVTVVPAEGQFAGLDRRSMVDDE